MSLFRFGLAAHGLRGSVSAGRFAFDCSDCPATRQHQSNRRNQRPGIIVRIFYRSLGWHPILWPGGLTPPPLLDAGKQPVKRAEYERQTAKSEQGLKACR
jgi:hypothetical protein